MKKRERKLMFDPHARTFMRTNCSEVLTHVGLEPPILGRLGVCPFHIGPNKSFRLSVNSRGFICHECGVSGSTANLIMRLRLADNYADAARWVEETLL